MRKKISVWPAFWIAPPFVQAGGCNLYSAMKAQKPHKQTNFMLCENPYRPNFADPRRPSRMPFPTVLGD